jgi:ubiquinone/menaquinone biosynthesis C-methylase UbiE
MTDHDEKYIPAAGFFSLAAFYDPLVRLLGREKQFKTQLIELAEIQPDHHVLDLGCGTATLTIMIQHSSPQAQVSGIDGDEAILAVARKKVTRSGLNIQLDEGMAYDLPYPDEQFDRVLTSLVLHHLSAAARRRALEEVMRTLKPDGSLHIADFTASDTGGSHLAAHLFSFLNPHSHAGSIPLLAEMTQCGFADVQAEGHVASLFGKIGFFSGSKPA